MEEVKGSEYFPNALYIKSRILGVKTRKPAKISCAPGSPTPLTILVRASLRCSAKGVVHSMVQDLQFLGKFSQGIAFISQNKNRLTSFRRKLFVSGHFEPVIEPTNADAPDTQLV